MARITVEDSALIIPNRFELVMVAAQRVRQILAGSELRVEKDGDKHTVVALREIAEHKVDVPEAFEQIAKGKQLFIESDDLDEDIVDMMDMEASSHWIGLEQKDTHLSEDDSFADALEDELNALENNDEPEPSDSDEE
ncbi:MAG: DNA-directed RNA polymerase subunit omega [Alphaproteobacteria bacterium 43-37]|nr:MAG: DNA-directed RNA polymerase subunit omega [Alphaproteobacteria bacterium 43-37]